MARQGRWRARRVTAAQGVTALAPSPRMISLQRMISSIASHFQGETGSANASWNLKVNTILFCLPRASLVVNLTYLNVQPAERCVFSDIQELLLWNWQKLMRFRLPQHCTLGLLLLTISKVILFLFNFGDALNTSP